MQITFHSQITGALTSPVTLKCDDNDLVRNTLIRACDDLDLRPFDNFELHDHTYLKLEQGSRLADYHVQDGDVLYVTHKGFLVGAWFWFQVDYYYITLLFSYVCTMYHMYCIAY